MSHKLDLGVFKSKWVQYPYNLFVCGSQVMSVLLGGDPDESISSRIGKAKRANKKWAVTVVAPALDAIIFELTGQRSHSISSIEDDEGAKTVWDWSK